MDPMPEQQELRKLLEETLEVSKDNQRMLHAMRRNAWASFFIKIIFWIIVLVLPLYLYSSYLAPLLPGGSSDLQTLINQYKTK